MKHILLAIFYTLSINMYSQSDTSIHRPFINSLKNTPKELFFSIGFGTSPAIGMFALSDKSDGFGRGVYLSVSVISTTAFVFGVAKGMKENKFKKHFQNYLCMSLGGVADAVDEELRHHYAYVKTIFPNMNDQYCNPLLSSYNKYKNGDPQQGEAFALSTSLFVAGTDLDHGLRAFNKTMWLGGLITFQKGKNVFYTIVEGVISIIVYTTAKGFTHYGLSH